MNQISSDSTDSTFEKNILSLMIIQYTILQLEFDRKTIWNLTTFLLFTYFFANSFQSLIILLWYSVLMNGKIVQFLMPFEKPQYVFKTMGDPLR